MEKPLLNTIGTPSGIQKVKGKKKGKKFVSEDKVSIVGRDINEGCVVGYCSGGERESRRANQVKVTAGGETCAKERD